MMQQDGVQAILGAANDAAGRLELYASDPHNTPNLPALVMFQVDRLCDLLRGMTHSRRDEQISLLEACLAKLKEKT